ncbi:MAG TPA: ABC transporter ATP-binding protein [Flavipsychrobacter sp.]|nr:ABC transporter ATP-binding protein [Flavipsychrobacter sp.]
MNIREGSPIAAISKVYKIFTPKQRKSFRVLVFFTFISSITDLLGLFTVIPVIGLVLSDSFYNTVITRLPMISQFDKQQLLLLSVLLFTVLIIAKNLFGLYINKMQVRFVEGLFVTSSMNVLANVYKRSLLEIQKDTSNELVQKLTSMQVSLCSYAVISIIIIINEAIVFGLTAVIVCLTNWQLFVLLILTIVPIMALFYAKVKTMIKNAGTERSSNEIKLRESAQEMIFGYTDIKIAGTENNFKKKFEDTAKKYSIFQGKLDFMLFIPTRIIEVAIFFCVVLIMLYGIYFIKDTEAIITTISLFGIVAYRSVPSINRFVIAVNNINSSSFIFEDRDFIYSDQQVKKNAESPLEFDDTITFENVSYSYEGNGKKNVLNNCSLQIRKGEKIGIIGKSGAGKSTLVGNILGFLRPTEGRIIIDQTPLGENNIEDWWHIVGYVRQEVFIMNNSMLENIAIGEDAASVDIKRMNRAIKLASLENLVNELPNGIHTKLSERGNNLSGGQKQRIAIARAIYKGAEVLVFDEATSALDSQTEEEITNAIQQLGREQLTIIIIAHRYTSLKYCDRIYDLQNGQISASLTYSELIKE